MKPDQELQQLLDREFVNYDIKLIFGGATNAELYEITSGDQHYILKKQSGSLRNDYENYEWLRGKVPVPEIKFYNTSGATEVLCMTKLRGESLEKYIDKVEPMELVRRFAYSLKWLHSLPIDDKAMVQHLDDRLSAAKFNLDNNLIESDELEPENQSVSLTVLYEKLLKTVPADSELVFTHGDYCFDNVLYYSETLSGFIDLNHGGMADKYQDIALAVRSVQEVYGEEGVEWFFQEYGLDVPNREKIAFYILLDEFF